MDSFQKALASTRRADPVLLILLAAIGGSAISFASEPLRVDVQSGISGLWAVHEASIKEDNIGVYTVLEVENVSAVARVGAAFYGEYFDASDRFCFAALFAQDENNEGRSGPFLPGEVRHLRTNTFYISPASRPTRLKLSRLSDPILDDRGEIRGGAGVLALPALQDVTLTGKPWERIWLDPEVEGAKGPFLDVILAKVRVDHRGDPEGVEIVSSVSPSARSWFEEYIHQQRFRPAMVGSEVRNADVLILVRAVVSLRCIRQKPWPPREYPPVREYVGRQVGKDLPPVITVMLNAVSRDFWRRLAPGEFEVLGIGSDWGVPAHPESAQEAPTGPTGLPSEAIVPPPEAYSCP